MLLRSFDGARHLDLADRDSELRLASRADRETNLVPRLGGLQYRLDVLDAGHLLLGDRRAAMETLVVAARHRRNELDRDVRDGSAHEELGGCLHEDASHDGRCDLRMAARNRVQNLRRISAGDAARTRGPLVWLVVDLRVAVPPQNLRASVMTLATGPGGDSPRRHGGTE